MFRGSVNVLFVTVLIYLTYFFTIFFSTRPPAPAAVSESARVAGKKIEELRAEERQLLTTYGPVNPATKSVRIPIDRAMDLIIAEGGRPAPAPAAPPTPVPAVATPKVAGAAAAAPKAAGEATAAPKAGEALPVPKPATAAAAPAPPPARVGMAPEQLYQAICIACHEADGRGTIVRKAMPLIPDLTDPKWQASHTDAEMIHTMLDGKGQFMLPMKDKFALAHTDPKEMLAYMRSFQTGKKVVAPATPAPAQTPAPSATPAVVALGSTTPAAPSPPAPASPAVSPELLRALTSPTPSAAPVSLSATHPALAPASTPSPALTHSTAPSPAMAANVHAAGAFYSVNCIACHGLDGKGSAAIRVAMPVLPDFTNREWQTTHSNPQLAVAILEGKGTLMPPWRGKVTPELAQGLIAFVRTFGPAGLGVEQPDQRIRAPIQSTFEAMGRDKRPGRGPVSSLRPATARL